MKRKNGFTLIELLAVIVVLAIIALIATPIVMNTIKNSKKGAAERSTENYLKQVETSLMTYRMNNNKAFPDGEYTIDSNGNLVGNEKTLTIEMSGNKPSNGVVVIENSEVKKENSFVFVGDYYKVTYNQETKAFVAEEAILLCKKNNGVDLENLTYGDKFTCELGDGENKTFYVLENNTNTVSLIMNMNIDENGKGTTSGNTVAWSSDGDNSNGPVTALEYLKNSTTSWTKLEENQISLPTYKQIYKASGNNYSNLPNWVYGNLNSSSISGYWMTTVKDGSSNLALYVKYSDELRSEYVDCANKVGIRPVITISKTQIK